MDTHRLPKQALQYKPNGRRNIGRPRKRWRDQLHLEDYGTGTCLTLQEHDDVDDVKYENFGWQCAENVLLRLLDYDSLSDFFMSLFEGTSAIVLNTEDSSRNFL